MSSTLTISGSSVGEPAGSRAIGPVSITNATAVGETISMALANGDNVITIPTGAVAVLIVPPSGNASTITYRTSLNNADGGVPISQGTFPFLHSFPSTPPTTITLKATGAISSPLTTVVFL